MHFVRMCTCTVLYTTHVPLVYCPMKCLFLINTHHRYITPYRSCTRLFSFLPCINIPNHQTWRHFSFCSIPCATCTYRHYRLWYTPLSRPLLSLCAWSGLGTSGCLFLFNTHLHQAVCAFHLVWPDPLLSLSWVGGPGLVLWPSPPKRSRKICPRDYIHSSRHSVVTMQSKVTSHSQ